MIEQTGKLGKLRSVHGISPAFLQHVTIVAVLSFIFFLLMLAGFYVRKDIGYFIISTAFLIIYILTMFGWLKHRRNVFEIYEHGFTFRGQTFRWNEIEQFEGRVESRLTGPAKIKFEIGKKTGEQITLTEAVADAEKIIELIREKLDEGAASDEKDEK